VVHLPGAWEEPLPDTEITGKVLTVLGPIEPEEMGVTLTHEHLLIDLDGYYEQADEATVRFYENVPVTMDILGRMSKLWFRSHANLRVLDEKLAVEEALRFRHAGGDSLVDTTSIGIARDPLALTRISRATGLNVVMGSSYYIPMFHPPNMDGREEGEIEEEIVRDVTVGVGDTGVRSGVIGEIGCTRPLEDNVAKVLRASARASERTGAAITIHPGFGPDSDGSPAEILDKLVEAGADPKQVIMGHIGPIVHDLGALRDLASSGVYIQHDLFGYEDTNQKYRGGTGRKISDAQRIERIEHLVERGFEDQLLVAQDRCSLIHLKAYGGVGYAHILESIVPRMRKRGFDQALIDKLLTGNPAKALAFA
jgi:phosphotriesterase-related protein